MTAMNINTNTYVIAIDNTSKAATLIPQDALLSNVQIYNDSDKPVFIVSGGAAAAPTAVYPTSATAPLAGKVCGSKAILEYSKNSGDTFISAIQAVSGTGNLYISAGTASD